MARKTTKVTKTVEHNIEVGMHATGWYWTDRYPFEVIKVSPSGKTITVRALDATPTKDYDYLANQEYTYTSNPNNGTTTVRFTKTGWKGANGMKFGFGGARKYTDPSF